MLSRLLLAQHMVWTEMPTRLLRIASCGHRKRPRHDTGSWCARARRHVFGLCLFVRGGAVIDATAG